MKSKKLIALLLAGSMCLPIMASCAKNPDDNLNTRSPDDSASSDDNFPEANYGNEDFTFLYIKHTDVGKDYYGGNYIDSESLEGLTIEDAVFTRNSAVEEKYRVNIVEKPVISGEPAKILQDYIMSGDYSYDVIYGWCYKLGAAITENYFADFYELQNNGTADLTAEYWSPSAIEDLTVGDKLYLCTNDISMNKLNWAGMLFFNKKLVEDYGVEEYLGTTLYDLVDSGKWTYDKYLDLIKYVNADLDGNGQITREDVFGLIDGNGIGEGIASACGIKNVKKSEDGSLVLDIYSEKILDIMNKVSEVYGNKNYVKSFNDIWSEPGSSVPDNMDEWEYARSFFTTDHALFCGGSAYITSEFRNMESEYGILPNPKYDENQENYCSNVDVLASIFALPSTVRSVGATGSMERTGTILEYMAYKSNEILLPVYYDTLLKGQRLNSPDDSRMLDIVRATVTYDLADAVGLEDVSKLRSQMFQSPAAAKSTYDRNARKVQRELDEFYTNVLLLKDKKAEDK